jgi:hypothetical protein
MMTFHAPLTLFLSLSLFSAACVAAPVETCESKAQAIEQQMAHAREQGQADRLKGLQKALTEVKANCTAQSLAAEKADKVKEKQQEVAERQQDLKEAQASGDKEKIAVRQKKLEEAIAELREAGQ